jgi:hypothetical protein
MSDEIVGKMVATTKASVMIFAVLGIAAVVASVIQRLIKHHIDEMDEIRFCG